MINPQAIFQRHESDKSLSWGAIDAMDWQLWALAILLIFVLGTGVLTFMFPTAFLESDAFRGTRSERLFFGFGVLLILVLLYLVQRQTKLRQLKRALAEAQQALAQSERDAAIQLFEALPCRNQFRDALAMEYRRAVSSRSSLVVVLFTVHHSTVEILGCLTRCLHIMLRGEESIYRISNIGVGVILPQMKLKQGASFAAHAEVCCGISVPPLEVRIIAYPEDTSSLAEIESSLREQDALN